MMIQILILITIVAIILLIYINSYIKLKDIHNKIDYSGKKIEKRLKDKSLIIDKINTEIKNKVDKKDYLKDFINIDKQDLTNIEKDIKLDEALKLIKRFKIDFPQINTENFNKLFKDLKNINEELIASKKLYNKYSDISNNLIRKIPNNLVAKITKKRIRAFYNTK